MTMRMRVKRLENRARGLPSAREDRWDDLAEEDWLKAFTTWGEEGLFAHEPDFPVALAFYRDALAQAKARSDPPFDPPDYFEPNLADFPLQRRANWRDRVRFPHVHAGWFWLMEMLRRRQEGIPPVSAVEFEELSQWFQLNEDRLRHLSACSGLLGLDAGRTTTVADLRYGLHEGVRASEAGELAEDLRLLRARYGEQ